MGFQFVWSDWLIVSKDEETLGRECEETLRHYVHLVETEETVQAQHLLQCSVILDQFLGLSWIRQEMC